MNDRPVTIGVLFSDLFDPCQRIILHGIKQQAKKFNARILCFVGGTLYGEAYIEKNALFKLVNRKTVDVVISISGAIGWRVGTKRLVKYIKEFGVPVISTSFQLEGIPSILVNNFVGMYELVKHFIVVHKRTKLAFIAGPDNNEEAVARFDAYKKGLSDHGIEFNNEYIFYGDFWPGDGDKAVKYFLDDLNLEFDALIGSDDMAVLEAQTALLRRGYNLPGDISLGGFDDIDDSQYSSPPLTTVRQPFIEMGFLGVTYALDLLDKKELPLTTYLDTRLIIRNSCGCSVTNLLDQNYDKNKTNIKLSGIKDIIESIKPSLYHSFMMPGTENEKKNYIKERIDELLAIISNSLINKQSVNEDVLAPFFGKSSRMGFDLSFWNNLLVFIVTALKAYNYSDLDMYALKNTFTEIFLIMYKSEYRIKLFDQGQQTHYVGQVQRVTNRILTCFNFKDLKTIIREEFPAIKIYEFMISLFTENKRYSELVFYHGPADFKKIEKIKFESHLIFPQELTETDDKSYLVLPFVANKKLLGHVRYQLSDISDYIYQYLTDKIAMSLQGIELVDTINEHAYELEQKVKLRTRELFEANQRLKEQTFNDQLSGLRNRRFLMEVVVPEIQEYLVDFNYTEMNTNKRFKGLNITYAVFMIDLDYFKHVNDTYGHSSGDMVIKQISSILRTQLRIHDTVVRMGGEEFLLILRNFNPVYLAEKAEDIRKEVEEFAFRIENNVTINKTCSIGAIALPVNMNHPNTFNFMTAISLADKALYNAKEDGRNLSKLVVVNESFFEAKLDQNESISRFSECIDKKYIEIKDARDLL